MGQAPMDSGVRRGGCQHTTLFSLYDNPIWRVFSSYIDRKTGTEKGILKTYKKPFFPRACSVLAEPKPVASAPLKRAGGLGWLVLAGVTSPRILGRVTRKSSQPCFGEKKKKTTVEARKMV